MNPSPERLWREATVGFLGGAALAVAMSWPLVRYLGSDIGKDLGDPLLQTWQVAWIGHAVLHAPLELWQANIYWPFRDTLAFSDALVGYMPAGLVSQLSPRAALITYNGLFLLAYALAFLGAYLLGREIGLRIPGAIAAGAAFAYAPWRLTQNGHLHVLSSGGFVLALFLLLRGYRRGSAPQVLAGWAVAAWQLTLGFTLGLQLAYVLSGATLAVGALVLAGRLPRPGRRVLVATLLGALLFVIAAGLMARPYLRVLEAHPEIERDRTPAYVEGFSPRLRSFFAAPLESWLWADATARARRPLGAYDELSLFPGLTIVVLAIVGALGSVLSKRLRIGLALGVAACALLSLGVRDVSGPEKYVTPYRVLFDFAPGWDAVRTPGRINTLTSLGLALLAGAGLCVVVRRVSRRSYAVAAATGAALVIAILLEGLGPLDHPRVPTPPQVVRDAPAPQLHLSTDQDVRYVYWSTAGFPAIVNGIGSFDPEGYRRLRIELAGFPDSRSVAALRRLGVRSVILHPESAVGSVWEDAATKPITGLGIDRTRVDGVILFQVR